jgi:DNA-binding transcriptional MerR regulator
MIDETKKFTLDDLCEMLELPRETVQLYIQQGLMDRPEGYSRRAYYTYRHLEQLLNIRKWREAGLSLERIGDLLREFHGNHLASQTRTRKVGSVEVWSHLFLSDGLELHVDPKQARLSAEGLKKLARGVLELYQRIKAQEEEEP